MNFQLLTLNLHLLKYLYEFAAILIGMFIECNLRKIK